MRVVLGALQPAMVVGVGTPGIRLAMSFHPQKSCGAVRRTMPPVERGLGAAPVDAAGSGLGLEELGPRRVFYLGEAGGGAALMESVMDD